MTVFGFDDYRNYLKHIVDDRGRGSITKLSKAAGCQRSYFSQCLSSEVNLTSDQIYGVSVYLQLKEAEADYLLLLLEREKSSSPMYVKKIQEKLNTLKNESHKLSKSFRKKSNKSTPNKYYSAWYFSAIHIATSIKALRTEKNIAEYLVLPAVLVEEVLRDLEEWRMVEYNNKSWNYSGANDIHLEDVSILNRLHHSNWRIQALSRKLSPDKDVNYTSVFTVSKKDARILRESLVNFIENQRQEIGRSGSEELISFCCDFTRYDEIPLI